MHCSCTTNPGIHSYFSHCSVKVAQFAMDKNSFENYKGLDKQFDLTDKKIILRVPKKPTSKSPFKKKRRCGNRKQNGAWVYYNAKVIERVKQNDKDMIRVRTNNKIERVVECSSVIPKDMVRNATEDSNLLESSI